MTGHEDGDMSGQDPLSSTAEGDEAPGTAELAQAGSGHPGADGGADDPADDAGTRRPHGFDGPPPEAADDEPVTDAPPASGLTSGD